MGFNKEVYVVEGRRGERLKVWGEIFVFLTLKIFRLFYQLTLINIYKFNPLV